MKKIPILAGMIVLQAVVSYFVLNSLLAAPSKVEVKKPVELTTYDFAELIVNPLDSHGRRYFIANVAFVFPAESLTYTALLDKNKPELIDTMMSIMMLRDIATLSSVEGRESLRVDLEHAVESTLKINIYKLLFKKYLIQ